LKFDVPGLSSHVAFWALAGIAASNAMAAVLVSKCARMSLPPG
jgi:hypothetical protein